MILTVTLNPALDKTVSVSRLTINGVNRVTSTRLDAGGKMRAYWEKGLPPYGEHEYYA